MDVLREKLIARYDELGLRASGKYEDEMYSEVTATKAIMYGPGHSEYMENGRGTGYVSPKIIEEWIEVKKGLPADMVENKVSASFAIAANIRKNGIQVPNTFNRGKVISAIIDEFMEKDVPELVKELGEVYLATIMSDVTKLFEQVA